MVMRNTTGFTMVRQGMWTSEVAVGIEQFQREVCAGGGQRKTSRPCEGARTVKIGPDELSDPAFPACHTFLIQSTVPL